MATTGKTAGRKPAKPGQGTSDVNKKQQSMATWTPRHLRNKR